MAGGVAVGGHAHELVFAAVHLESEEIGESTVEEANGVGEMELFERRYRVALPMHDCGSAPFTNPVNCQYGRFFKGGREKSAPGVGQVVFRKKNFDFPASKDASIFVKFSRRSFFSSIFSLIQTGAKERN